MTSTSTSHSGRARPATTMPVDTGKTPSQPAPSYRSIHGLAIARIGQINRNLADVLEPGARLGEQLLDIPPSLLIGLCS